MKLYWKLKVLFLFVVLVASGKPVFSQTSSASNILLVQSVECEQSGINGSYACTLTPTGTGHLLTAQEFNFADIPGTPATPAGWTQDCVKNNGSAGQITYYSYPNAPSGITSVIFIPSSGASSAVVSEWSGMATSSPFDACDGHVDNGQGGAHWFSGAKHSSQTDLAIAAALNRTNDANGFAPSDVWSELKDAPQTHSGAEGWTAYIVNGSQSPFTAVGTTISAVDVLSSVALYKSAVAGTAPTGALVSSYSDFESGTDGTTLTAAILDAGTHGMGINQWTLNNPSGFTVCTAGSLPSYSKATTNGTTYAAGAGTRGICYNMANGGADYAYEHIPSDHLTVNVYVNVNVGTNVTSYSSPVFVGAPGADVAAFTINSSGQLALECSFLNPQDYLISPTTLAVANTTYGIWLQFVGGGMHTIKIYSNPTTNPQLMGTATCPAQGTNYATEVGIGEFHAGAVALTGTREFDSFMWEVSGAGINIAPPGNTVSSYSDFESGSDGNPVTTTILDAGTHGAGVGQWTVDTGGFNVCTSGSLPSFLPTTVIGGSTYPSGAGTRGICYNMQNGGTALENMSSQTATLYMNVNLGADAAHYSNPVIIGNFGVDDAAFTINASGQLELECPFATPQDYPISGSNQAQANTTYGIWLQYDSAIGHHTIKIYSNPTTNPQLIGTATCPAQGSTAATTLGIGEFHAGAVGLTGIRSFDSLLWDVSGHGINVISTAPDFAISATPVSASLTSGQSAAINLSVSGSNGFAQPVTFTCSGLPAMASCSFSPASVTPGASSAATTTLTITTISRSADLFGFPNQPLLLLCKTLSRITAICLLLYLYKTRNSFRAGRRTPLITRFAAIVVLAAGSLAGCGAATNGGTPAGTYTVSVTASSNNLTHQLNLTLIVK
jgi:hypothetical protein